MFFESIQVTYLVLLGVAAFGLLKSELWQGFACVPCAAAATFAQNCSPAFQREWPKK
jgi:hypothetical protein